MLSRDVTVIVCTEGRVVIGVWVLLAAAGCRVWACCDGVVSEWSVECGVGVRVAGSQSRSQARSHSNSQVVVVVG